MTDMSIGQTILELAQAGMSHPEIDRALDALPKDCVVIVQNYRHADVLDAIAEWKEHRNKST